MRCSRTEAPSLHRRYPASSVLRASPPPCSARPDPRGLSVGACHATGRASRVASIPLVHTCRRHYPGGTGRCSRRSLPDRWQPSPYSGRVGFRITRFEACAAFTSLRPAWSLNRPGRSLSSECFSRCRYLHRPLRLLPAGATVAGRDSHPLRNGAFHGAPEHPVIRTLVGAGGVGPGEARPSGKHVRYAAQTMLTTVGLHPLAATAIIAVDSMLFGGTVVTGGLGWAVSVPAGVVLGVAAGLIQHRGSPQDNPGLAAGKGLVVAVLTAIPTPLPAALVAGAGTAGAVTMFRQRRLKRLSAGESDE